MSMYEKYYQDKRSKDLRFLTYAYAPPTNYKLNFDGYETAPIKDFRTVERYQEYKETGFNALLMQTSGTYSGEEWETSGCKLVLDRAYQAGIEKVIVLDERLRSLSQVQGGLVGEGKRFATLADLESHVADCMKDYKNHPAFFGVQLRDEPNWKMFEAIGQVYKAVKKAVPTAFVQCNLFPLIAVNPMNNIYPDAEDGDMYERYEAYLKMFLDETGADYVMYDNYPLNVDKGIGTPFYRLYFRGQQIAAKVCKERGVQFALVMQAYGMTTNGVESHRVPNEAEMFYQMNSFLGFGGKQISYFTYWTKGDNRSTGEGFPDGWAMMTRMGEKTPVYYAVQKVNAMAQKLAPVLLNFEYVDDKYLLKSPIRTHAFHTEYTKRGKLSQIVKAETSGEVALINELYDKNNKQYLYRIQNITYNYYEEKLGLPKQKTTVKFAPEYTKIDIFDGENWRTEELVNGEYTAELAAGYAEYIMAY